MENISKYGDLTDDELTDLLNEIEDDNEELEESRMEAEKATSDTEEKNAIADPQMDAGEEKIDVSSLDEDEIANLNAEAEFGSTFAWHGAGPGYSCGIKLHGDEYRKQTSKRIHDASREKRRLLAADKVRIQREAFNQSDINLSDEIGDDNIRLLISALVKENTVMMEKYEAFINRRLQKLLLPLVPLQLRKCSKAYPNSVRMSPGFLYRASKEYGDGRTFWASPEIPYYFKQGEEQKIALEQVEPFFFVSIDEAVKAYNRNAEKRTEREVKYASMIYKKKVKTYFDLLKYNPFWYETLYNILMTEKENHD